MTDDDFEREAWETSFSLVTAVLLDDLDSFNSVLATYFSNSSDEADFTKRLVRLLLVSTSGVAGFVSFNALDVGESPLEYWQKITLLGQSTGAFEALVTDDNEWFENFLNGGTDED